MYILVRVEKKHDLRNCWKISEKYTVMVFSFRAKNELDALELLELEELEESEPDRISQHKSSLTMTSRKFVC